VKIIVAAGLVFTLLLSLSLDSYSENINKKKSKISSALSYAISDNVSDEDIVQSTRFISSLRHIDEKGDIRVYIEIYQFSAENIAILKENGVEIEIYDESRKLIQAKIPSKNVELVSSLSFVKFVDLPNIGFTNSGSVQTEGDAVLKADQTRSGFGIDGTGVKVAVISDGIDGLSESTASGDIPETGIKVSSTPLAEGGVSVDDPCPEFIPLTSTPIDREDLTVGPEGLAMLEIIHDIAPGAELYFAPGLGTDLELIRSKRCLSEVVDIIADDIGVYNSGPYDGTSPISLESTASVQSGVANFISVGNDAQQHYTGLFTDTDGDGLHEFDVSLGIPVDGEPAEVHTILVPPFGEVHIFLQWDDPFGSSDNDYGLRITVDGESFDFNDTQDGDGDPTENVTYENDADEYVLLEISIFDALKINGLGSAQPKNLELFHIGSDALTEDYIVEESSVPNNADADLVCSVGSVGIASGDLLGQSPDEIRSYSSRGPTNDGRLKPELVAPDGVSITGNGDFDVPFFGTSAAAPHAAGVAALVLEADTSLAPEELTTALQSTKVLSPPLLADILSNTAIDLGQPGPDNTFGFGRIDAFAAVQSVLGSEPMPSPTPTASAPPGDSSGSNSRGSCSIGGSVSTKSVYVNALAPIIVLFGVGLITRLRRRNS